MVRQLIFLIIYTLISVVCFAQKPRSYIQIKGGGMHTFIDHRNSDLPDYIRLDNMNDGLYNEVKTSYGIGFGYYIHKNWMLELRYDKNWHRTHYRLINSDTTSFRFDQPSAYRIIPLVMRYEKPLARGSKRSLLFFCKSGIGLGRVPNRRFEQFSDDWYMQPEDDDQREFYHKHAYLKRNNLFLVGGFGVELEKLGSKSKLRRLSLEVNFGLGLSQWREMRFHEQSIQKFSYYTTRGSFIQGSLCYSIPLGNLFLNHPKRVIYKESKESSMYYLFEKEVRE